MIYSRSKREDMAARADMLECIEICLRNGLTDQAREIGEASAKLKHRIENHPYSKETKWGITQPTVENK